MLQIWLFGAVSYRVDEDAEIRVTDLRYPRVLAYLALRLNELSTKSEIRAALWGQKGAEDNLRRALRELRADHPQLAAYIRDEGRTLVLDPPAAVDLDVMRFRSLVQAERYDEALAEVRGDFMADHPPNLSSWIDVQRRDWNRQVARVCQTLAARDWRDGRPESSIDLARRAARLTPRDPGAAIALAGYLAGSGQADDARAQLQSFRGEQRRLGQEVPSIDRAIASLDSGRDLPEPGSLPSAATTSAVEAPLDADDGHDRRQPRRLARPALAVTALALVGVALGLSLSDGGPSRSRLPVEQPDVAGIAPAAVFRRLDAQRYHSVLRALEPELALSFDADREEERPRDATLNAPGLFGGAADLALVGGAGARAATVAPVSALVGDAPRTVILWVRTARRGPQTLLDVGRSVNAARMLLAVTAPSSVPQAPDRRSGVVLVLYDADVFLPGVDLSDDRWHQIAFTLDRGNARVMVDGELPQAFVWDGARYDGPRPQPVRLPATPATSRTRVSLTGVGPGTRTRTWRAGLRGRLDELAIFDRALSPTTIEQLPARRRMTELDPYPPEMASVAPTT